MGATLFFGTLSLAEPNRAHGASTPPVERAVLPNGLRVLLIRQPHLPMVVVSALVDAGSRFDADGKEGLASLTANLLTEGTEKRSAAEIHDAIDVLGAKLGTAAGDDYASASLTVLKKDLAEMVTVQMDDQVGHHGILGVLESPKGSRAGGHPSPKGGSACLARPAAL